MGFGKGNKGVIFRQQDSIVLLTAAALAVVKQANPPSHTDSFRVIKSEGHGSIELATDIEGDGPLELYLTSDDLSVTEIAASLGPAGGMPLARDDIVGSEQASRPVFYLGTVPFVDGSAGKRIFLEWSKTIRWTFGDTAGMTLCMLNRGSGALSSGASFRFQHTAFGVWVGA